MNWLEFLLMTLFNAAVCVSLPRLVTLNWSKAIARLTAVHRSAPFSKETPELSNTLES